MWPYRNTTAMLSKAAVLFFVVLFCHITCAKPTVGAGVGSGRTTATGDGSTSQLQGKSDLPITSGKKIQHRYPIVLVPGLGGSQLWAKLDHTKHRPHFYCYRTTTTFYNIWLSLTELIPEIVDCLVENLRLHYDSVNRTTRNTEGVDIQALNFGHPKSVEWLDPYFDDHNDFNDPRHHAFGLSASSSDEMLISEGARYMERQNALRTLGDKTQAVRWLDKTPSGISLKKGLEMRGWKDPGLTFSISNRLANFKDMVEALVSSGYRRGRDLMAAPYDFRKAPNEMAEYYRKVKKLIEDTYRRNNNSRVVMVAHSMGNPVMLYFYNHVVSQQWKNKFLRSHVALSAPWAGAVKSVKLMCTGDSLGVTYLWPNTIRTVQRSMTSTAWLLPSTSFWKDHEVLVSTPHRNYTVNQYQQLFHDLGYPEGYQMWLNTRNLNSDFRFPGVEMHVLYGRRVKTAGRLVYTGSEFPDDTPQEEIDNGDGTVNIRSLEAFKLWKPRRLRRTLRRPRDCQYDRHRLPRLSSLALDSVTHGGILKDPRAIQYVSQVVTD